ncbi:hypothetical protein A2U01_0107015, partial [Trifolium medium]|nr:hypothetical protein [Trifolium medium]
KNDVQLVGKGCPQSPGLPT